MTALFTQRCSFYKNVQSIDSVGHPSYVETIIASNVRCKLDPTRMRSTESPESGAAKSIFRSMLYCENVEGLVPDNFVELDSVRYQIVSISPVTNMIVINHLELEVVKVGNV